MGDDGGDVEAASDHGFHLVPGFEDFAAVDAFDEEAFEDDFVPVDASGHAVASDGRVAPLPARPGSSFQSPSPFAGPGSGLAPRAPTQPTPMGDVDFHSDPSRGKGWSVYNSLQSGVSST